MARVGDRDRYVAVHCMECRSTRVLERDEPNARREAEEIDAYRERHRGHEIRAVRVDGRWFRMTSAGPQPCEPPPIKRGRER